MREASVFLLLVLTFLCRPSIADLVACAAAEADSDDAVLLQAGLHSSGKATALDNKTAVEKHLAAKAAAGIPQNWPQDWFGNAPRGMLWKPTSMMLVFVFLLLPLSAICASIHLALMSKDSIHEGAIHEGENSKLALTGRDISLQNAAFMEVHCLLGHVPSFWDDPFCSRDFKWCVLQRAIPRFVVALSFWWMGLYCNNLSQAWLQSNMAGYYESHWTSKSASTVSVTLWDIGYAVLPSIRGTKMVEVFCAGFPVLVMLRFVAVPGPFSMRWTILSRMLLIWGVLWFLRSIMIISTVLPNPDHSCRPHATFPNSLFLEAFVIFWSDTTCQDVFFSGHTALLTLSASFVLYYNSLAPWPQEATSLITVSVGSVMKSIAFVSMAAGYYSIIASKFHYTVDVLVAFIVTILISVLYHSTVSSVLQSQPLRFIPHSIVAFIGWFEEDAPDIALLKIVNESSKDEVCRDCRN